MKIKLEKKLPHLNCWIYRLIIIYECQKRDQSWSLDFGLTHNHGKIKKVFKYQTMSKKECKAWYTKKSTFILADILQKTLMNYPLREDNNLLYVTKYSTKVSLN